MLESSAEYLNEIVSTTISGANIAASDSGFVALSSFRAEALVEPLSMMFKTPFAGKKLTLDVRVVGRVTIVSDRRSEEHTSELQSLMRISYAVFCLKKKTEYKKSKRSS